MSDVPIGTSKYLLAIAATMSVPPEEPLQEKSVATESPESMQPSIIDMNFSSPRMRKISPVAGSVSRFCPTQRKRERAAVA